MLKKDTAELCRAAKAASAELALLSSQEKNAAIEQMAECLREHKDDILRENAKDLEAARGRLSESMLDRLMLNDKRISQMLDAMREIAATEDPVGRVLGSFERKDGLRIDKVSVPLGVIAVIYESRPNVTSDAAVLAFKSGNACVLRGGKESFNSSFAVVSALREGLYKSGISMDAVSLVTDLDRSSAETLMKAQGLVDLLIPRGGAGLINSCIENARVPCLQTGTGICHIYVDRDADLEKALNIVDNAKTSRPSVCNAAEVCLVHQDIAPVFLPALKRRLVDDRQREGRIPVELRLCSRSAELIEGKKALYSDFDTEFLDLILAVKTVSSADEAIEHIRKHSTGHSEAVISENREVQERFTRLVDSAAVYVNASTRFTDGGEFGLGCEIGISTQKLHARGPVGTEALNTSKYIIRGNGQIR